MASIKDVALKANVSISTVSIIINGKSEERKISKETQIKVLQAMKDLNYQPNLSAKKLRSQNTRKTIALFWTTDFRDVMLARFLNGLHTIINKEQLDFDIVIYPYKNNELYKEEALKTVSYFHGAIIANASENDIEFLKELAPLVPIVLYNRVLDKYSSVSVDDYMIGQYAYDMLKDKENVAIIKAPYVFKGMKIRDDVFIEKKKHVFEYYVEENDAASGFDIADKIDFHKIDAIYTPSDMIALGIMHYCYLNQIKIPQDVSILSIGNGLTQIDQFLNPSLSTIQIPMEEMAQECLSILIQLFENNRVIHKVITPTLDLRASYNKERED